MEKINITIGPDGSVNLDLSGFEGGKCLEATKAIEALLGGEVDRKLTSEFYTATEEVQQTEEISAG
ncbi:MAG: DUF2997 domain-containing protein [Deltaproteobacteria bacterium]|nr:DUF2997 domain-containing protein [Deltaproteobacteria bacterium]